MAALAGAVRMQQTAIAPEQGHDTVHGTDGGLLPVAAAEDQGGLGEAGNHQAVPVGENLVVEAGRNPLRPLAEKHLARGGEPLFGCLVPECEPMRAVEDGLAFPIAVSRYVVDGAK